MCRCKTKPKGVLLSYEPDFWSYLIIIATIGQFIVTIIDNSDEIIDVISNIICIIDVPDESPIFTPPHCQDDFTKSVIRRRLFVVDQVGYAVEKFTYIFKRVPTTFLNSWSLTIF